MPRVLFALLLSSAAALNVSNVFSTYAVLQRNKPVVVWGWASAAGDVVTAEGWVDGATYKSSAASADQFWSVTFPPSPARAAPFNLTFSCGPEAVMLEELLLGDVISCNGQSNMGAVQVTAMANASAMVAAAAQLQWLRIFQVSGNLNSSVPLREWPTTGLVPWQPPITPAGTNATLLGFSAVCFIMGSTLYSEYLNGAVPIGLLHSSHGGTSLQAWQSPASVGLCGDPPNSWPSSVLFNSNFRPITVGPMALAAIYWYQGEQDCGIGPTESYARADWYSCALPALITDWRSLLQDDSIFFVVQQLHAWMHTADVGLPLFRQAQLKALALPNVGLSTAFDGGDPAQAEAGSPGGTVHSHFKFIPGRRTAATLAGAYYQLPNVPFVNPAYEMATATSVSNATHTTLTVEVALTFVTSGGLVLRGYDPMSNSSHCPTERNVTSNFCGWFGIQVNDVPANGTWLNASVALTPDAQGIVLQAVAPHAGLSAVATRFGFADWPVATVYSIEGLPLMTWSNLIFG